VCGGDLEKTIRNGVLCLTEYLRTRRRVSIGTTRRVIALTVSGGLLLFN